MWSEPRSKEPMPYFARIWETITITVAVVLIVTVVAYIWSSSQPTVYTASTRLVVTAALRPGSGGDAMLTAPLIARTWAVLATTKPLLAEAIELADLPYRPEQLAGALEVTSESDVGYLKVAVTDEHPERATAAANALAEVLVERAARGGLERSSALGAGVPILRVAEVAELPEDPSGPRVFFNTIVAAGAALVLCLALASGIAYIRGTRP